MMERAPLLPMVLLLVGYRYWCAAPNDAVTGNPMRKLLKFGHSMTAITFLGSVVVLWVFHHYLPPPAEALEIYVAERQVMERVASLVMMPSLLLSLLFGLASMAAVPGYHGAPWAWAKLVTTVLMLEGSLLGIQSPLKREALLAERALADPAQLSQLAQNIASEQSSLVLIGVVATANVALGVWRPRFRSKTTAST
jgi:uncharacterized membrane protein